MTLHRDEVGPEHLEATSAPTAPTRLRAVTHLIPMQSPGEHDALPDHPGTGPEARPGTGADVLPLIAPGSSSAHPAWGVAARTAEWTAPQPGRYVTGGLLLVALTGTGVLGWRYYDSGATADLRALVVGLAVVVVLWGLTVAATPQVVSVRDAVLTVFSGRDQERYDLADPHQQVDLVDEPGSPSWALVLHRPDGSARVLRRSDVDAVALDALVRRHRDRAADRAADREGRRTR